MNTTFVTVTKVGQSMISTDIFWLSYVKSAFMPRQKNIGQWYKNKTGKSRGLKMIDFDGDTLRELREQSGYTQSQLAESLGYFSKGEPNRSMISRMENGHCKINRRLQMLLENFFQKEIAK